MRFTLTLLFILLSLKSFAISFDGKVTLNKGGVYLNDRLTKQTYALTGSTPIISTYLNKLSDGDFLSVEGGRVAKQSVIAVDSVNYIGLSALLGSWIGDDMYCYSFTSFTEFSISRRGYGKKCLPVFSPSYTYFVNPSTDSWVMLLAGDRGSYVGDLIINNAKDAEIQLYDSETGDILRKIHLRK